MTWESGFICQNPRGGSAYVGDTHVGNRSGWAPVGVPAAQTRPRPPRLWHFRRLGPTSPTVAGQDEGDLAAAAPQAGRDRACLASRVGSSVDNCGAPCGDCGSGAAEMPVRVWALPVPLRPSCELGYEATRGDEQLPNDTGPSRRPTPPPGRDLDAGTIEGGRLRTMSSHDGLARMAWRGGWNSRRGGAGGVAAAVVAIPAWRAGKVNAAAAVRAAKAAEDAASRGSALSRLEQDRWHQDLSPTRSLKVTFEVESEQAHRWRPPVTRGGHRVAAKRGGAYLPDARSRPRWQRVLGSRPTAALALRPAHKGGGREMAT